MGLFLQTKSQAFYAFIQFKTHVEKLLSTSIICFQSDGGGEFKTFTPYLHSQGVEHRFSCLYSSQQNGIVERKHRHIVDIGLTILSQSSIPFEFWDDTFSATIYLIN